MTPAPGPLIPGVPDIGTMVAAAVQAGLNQIWPTVKAQIIADLPEMMEHARPTIRSEVNNAAVTFALVSVSAIGALVGVHYLFERRKR
jgi:hypothetical protein